ncbi:O-methyltransferase [Saccharopolyspora erythraea NRRL 2338]|uniref:O-methyltransferase n=2 Tax=Saccharopolyspora erythraea TaxID=1836 RepID=A4FIP4_SACEN|nr:methyltransferase [Saccharopolyspora erythraea]EQD85875.1 SAM-dependent methyltransferase [Saccharopolyspora erythraea D]PFG97594.1 O-methyltransferase [Saccharopolyspora erythraea NRRL 2338]QRK87757.1 SAM-dependent methyltransferase [Saccharopolyspora erythraea]CAM03919.1 O-methyltransferase [Saccharopolyspora erythraea NRRL 2338]
MPHDSAAELARLVDLATPFAIRTAVALRLPELVEAGTTGLAELAAASECDEDSLARLLRHLVSVGLFDETSPGTYGLTALSRELLGEDQRWQRGWLDIDGPGAKMDLAYTGMLHSVRTGESAYGRVHGVGFWEDYQRDERLRLFFGAIMAAHAWQTGPAVAAEYDWSGARRVLDVGGGTGALLSEVLLKHSHLTGAVLDLPPVRPEAEQALADAGLSGRAEFVGGSFFDPLPTGYDVVMVSRVLTDWNDEDAAKILRRCGEAAGPQGRVLVVEVLAGDEHAKNNSSFDLQSLTLLGGRERTVTGFHALAAAAGLQVRTTHRLPGGLVVVECAG